MSFHHEWAWYNIYYPNPDAAVCRFQMNNAEWHRMARWRDLDWFKRGGLETGKILLHNRNSLMPAPYANYATPHLLPAAGMPSASHARGHAYFYNELFQRMLEERQELIKRGQLAPDPAGYTSSHSQRIQNFGKHVMTAGQRNDLDSKKCLSAITEMERNGWFDCP